METSNIPTGSQQPTAAPQQEPEASLEPELFSEDELLDTSASDDHSMPADAVNLLEGIDPIYAVRFTRKRRLCRPCPLAPGVYGRGSCIGYQDSYAPYVCGYSRFVIREDELTLNDLVERLSAWYWIGDEYCYIDRIYYSPSTRRLIVCETTAEEVRARREAVSDFR